ncbi:MAG: 30S ribosomal protein S5 [Candidatus Yonathbacteria bacterium]|nr:30S ribosomal protein S5 [Candidatus Yonathbacteria bacterium]NTW47512.1 30S ribosomal protein S5 [Candidatus Yonathbacteria bacterium]
MEHTQTSQQRRPATRGSRPQGGSAPARRGGPSRGGASSSRGGRPERRTGEREKVRSEYDQKIIDTRRVTRVVSGGRRFSFSITIVIGDKKGSVGVGIGKAGDTALAIEKATRDAKKNMIKVKRTKEDSIPHAIESKVGSARLTLKPAPGRGIVAGSSVRTVLEMAGLKDVGAKIYSRSKNKLGIARATVKALAEL